MVGTQRNETYNDRRKVHDIVGEYMSEVVMVVEVKSPFHGSKWDQAPHT